MLISFVLSIHPSIHFFVSFFLVLCSVLTLYTSSEPESCRTSSFILLIHRTDTFIPLHIVLTVSSHTFNVIFHLLWNCSTTEKSLLCGQEITGSNPDDVSDIVVRSSSGRALLVGRVAFPFFLFLSLTCQSEQRYL